MTPTIPKPCAQCGSTTACCATADWALRIRIAELEAFVRDCAFDWDCDFDGHKHETQCRACDAEALWRKRQP